MKQLVIALFAIVFVFPVAAEAYWSVGSMDWEAVPRIVYGPGEDEAIRAKLEREPYLTLYKRVLNYADRTSYDLEDHDKSAEQNKANIAQAASFVWAMDRKVAGESVLVFETEEERLVYGLRAEELLLHMYTESRFRTGLTSGIEDIHTAQELAMWATAYDLLRGSDYPFAENNEELIVGNLVTLAREFFKDWMYDQVFQARSLNENHLSKSAAALGVAAIVLNGYEPYNQEEDPEGYGKPQNWIDFAVVKTDFITLDALVSREGSFSEGPPYFAYSAINHMPFFRAMHRYVGEGGYALDGFDYGDMLFREENQRIHDWFVKISMPDGTSPPMDDSTPHGQYSYGMVSDLPRGGLYRWAWERQKTSYFSSGSVRQEIFTIANFDDEVQPVHPADLGWSENQFLYDGGQAVFRSSWDTDATYLIAMAEHGKAAGWAMRRDGEPIDGAGGHDHNDPGAIHLYAIGKPLLLDAGYLGWTKHDLVNKPKNHNILLVNGKGPENIQMRIPHFEVDEEGNLVPVEDEEGGWVPGDDGEAFLNDSFDLEGLAYARIDTRYDVLAPATDIARHILFVDDRYFFVFDQTKGENGEPRTVTILWHGNGGGDSGGTFEMLEDGGRWIYEGAEIVVRTESAQGDLSWVEDLDIHDPGNRVEHTHSVIKGSIEHAGPSFYSVLLPQVEGSGELSAEKLDGEGWRILDTSRPDVLVEFVSQSQSEEISACNHQATAKALYCSESADNLEKLLLIDGNQISKEETAVFSSSSKLRIAIAYDYETKTISGHIGAIATPPAIIELDSPWEGEVVELSGLFRESSDSSFVVHRPGPFSIRYGEGDPIMMPVAVVSPKMTEITLGESIVISGAASCTYGDNAEFAYELVEKPYASLADIEEADGGVTFLPDMVGHFLYRLNVTDGSYSNSDTGRVFVKRQEPVDGDEDTDGDEDIEAEQEIDLDTEQAELAEDGDIWEEPEPIDGDGDTVPVDGDEETGTDAPAAYTPPGDGGGGGCSSTSQSAYVWPMILLVLFAVCRKTQKAFFTTSRASS